MLIAFHKPYGVLSQFTEDGSPNQSLAGFGFPPDVYPIGRLDAGSTSIGFGPQASAFLTRLHASLESLIASDMNKDWMSVADVLEHEIAGMLPDWATLLQDVGRDLVAARSAE